MLFRNRVVLMTGMTFALVAGTVAAQAPADIHEHRGFWIGFGLGGGVNLSEGLDGERLGGGAGYLRLGGTVSQRVLLGFDGIFWGRDENGNSIARGNSSFAMLFYPSGRGGGFLKGGLGWSNIARVTTSGNSTTTTTKSGFGLTLGTGWDVRLGHNLYLTPNLDFLFQAFSSEVDPVLGEIPGTNTILLFTLGLTWH
ncbi:MAG: hypothetical protein DMD62_00135 [Gemmatimonadetes bacterium]|nr:MAG: hypothetical protein DMD62_00135 [Gemmatimonadota bacterium]